MPNLDTFHNATALINVLSPQLYPRESFKTRVTPNETQRNTLIVAGCYILIIGILWYAPTFWISVWHSIYSRCCTYRHVPYLKLISEHANSRDRIHYLIVCMFFQFILSSKLAVLSNYASRTHSQRPIDSLPSDSTRYSIFKYTSHRLS